MKTFTLSRSFLGTLFALCAVTQLTAQTDAPGKATGDALQLRGELTAAINPNVMADAVQQRSDLANDLISGRHTSVEALQKLHAIPSPTGMHIDPEADFALAAIDVGHRLIAQRKPKEAEAFFQEAETALNAVIDRTSDSLSKDKVQYLQARALIRVEFLNKLSGGRSDFDAALKLSPGDKRLQQMRLRLSADPAAILKNHVELPTKG